MGLQEGPAAICSTVAFPWVDSMAPWGGCEEHSQPNVQLREGEKALQARLGVALEHSQVTMIQEIENKPD